ncbi:MAG: polysaccharide pyruvyl transferase family protein [Ilumatobacteraceae bacterium]
MHLFEYSNSTNLGDDIQTLAAGQHLDQIDGYVDRDHASTACADHEFALVMQGWFTKNPDVFPLAAHIRPIWIGFHLTPTREELLRRPDVREFLVSTGPIGCRDQPTVEILRRHDIDAYLTGCLTTTFPLRDRVPDDGRVFLVDTGGVPLPDHLRGPDAVRITHEGASWWPLETKRALAARLLSLYRDEARLVVTTRLHCALPCVAMGIPVIFVGDGDEGRLQPIQGLAEVIDFPPELRSERLTIRARRKALWWRELRDRPWEGFALDIEDRKTEIVARLRDALAEAGAS